jgi:hypothetical protein
LDEEVEVVVEVPRLGDLAVLDAVETDARDLDVGAGALEVLIGVAVGVATGVLGLQVPVGDDEIAFGDEVIDAMAGIREGAGGVGEALLDGGEVGGLAVVLVTGVADVVVVKELVDDVDVALEDLGESVLGEALDERLVCFGCGGHAACSHGFAGAGRQTHGELPCAEAAAGDAQGV